jgi:4-alpha-glucanotransferase
MQYSKNVLKRLYFDYYFHRQEDLWRQNALKTLPALLNSSEMLACGEDLGLIPSCVHPVCQLYSLSTYKQEPLSHSCAHLPKHKHT